MYNTSNFGHDGDEWISFLTVILEYGYKQVKFVMLLFKGLFREFVMIVCKLYELECDGLGRGDGERDLIGSSYYA